MKSALVPILAITVVAFAAGAASAASPTVSVNASHGFAIGSPTVRGSGQGLSVSGDVCRRSQTALRPVLLRVERIDGSGAVTASETTTLSGALSRRSRGCAFYSVRTDWQVGAGESMRVTTLTAPELAH